MKLIIKREEWKLTYNCKQSVKILFPLEDSLPADVLWGSFEANSKPNRKDIAKYLRRLTAPFNFNICFTF